MGAFWVRKPFADLLGPGTHATTFGGTPLACAVALEIFHVIERDKLADNARQLGESIKARLKAIAAQYPAVVKQVRGMGLMVGFELQPGIAALAASPQAPSIHFVNKLHEAGVLAIPSGAQVIRLLPALNLTAAEAQEGLNIIESVVAKIAP